uniref:Cytochrome P450 4C1 n=2 Tax=Lygus hesperus TaxID=30085 RepID=A0A0K8SWN4_LYGHE
MVVLVLVAVILVLLAVLYLTVPSVFRTGSEARRLMSKIHGPPGLPFIGMGLKLCRLAPDELIDFLREISIEYPRLTKLWVAAVPFVVMQEPDDLEVILGSTKYIMKGLEYIPLQPWLQDGLLVSRGAKWQRRRKMLTPTSHFRILEDNLTSLNTNARLFVRNVLRQNGKPLDIDAFITLCTIDVMSETAMGIKLNAQENESKDYLNSVKRVSYLAVERVIRFWLFNDFLFSISSIGKEFRKNLKVLHDFTEKIIIERKSAYITENHNIITNDDGLGKKRPAFLDSMIEMDLKEPDSFTNKDIREEVDTFMFEGHDTTSAAILFALFLVGHHPDVQEKIYEELFDIFGDSTRNVTMQDLPHMNYLEKVIKETLRLYPSVPYISRFLTKNCTLGDGTVLPRGTNVMILPYLLHRHPKYFEDPEKFDPERFSPDLPKRHPYAYIPFSAGPRNCIGQKFAMMELKILLSTVFRYTRVESITKPGEFKLLPHLILRPNKPIIVKITKREQSAFEMQ